MDQKTAKAAMQFLMRVELKGVEVPAFNAVMTALEELGLAQAPEAQLSPAPPFPPKASSEGFR